MNETIVTAVGNLATEVEHAITPKGVPVAHFRVACNERRWDRVMQDFVDGDTFYIRVSCWRTLADNVRASFRKGDPVLVRGRIFSRHFDRDGVRHYVTEMEANAVGADVGRCTVAVARRPRRAEQGVEVLSASTGAAVAGEQESAVNGRWESADERRDEMIGSRTGDLRAGLVEAVPAACH